MALDFDTPLDRISSKPPAFGKSEMITIIQGTCLVVIEAFGFAASTLLIVLGLPLFIFLFFTGWDLGLLFAQLGNLADHYQSAEPLARRFFSQDLKIGFLAIAGGFTLLRIPGFLRHLQRRLEEEGPRHG